MLIPVCEGEKNYHLPFDICHLTSVIHERKSASFFGMLRSITVIQMANDK